MFKVFKFKDITFSNILYWILVAFVIFVIYQLSHKLLGGSWSAEPLIIALLIANLGYTYNINSKVENTHSRLEKHLGIHEGYQRAREQQKTK